MKQFYERQFSAFNSHLDLAHDYWEKILQPEDWAIDATCGNGHDTQFLAQKCAGVIGLDIQPQALVHTKQNAPGQNIFLFLQSHEIFPDLAHQVPVKLVAYNLGYLPGADKQLTTQTATTLLSVGKALDLIVPGGIVSLTCYPGHPEGQREEEALINFCKTLSAQNWSVCFHQWLNRSQSPSLIIIQKLLRNCKDMINLL